MQRVNEFVFYELAVKIHQLTLMNLHQPTKFTDIWLDWGNAREALDEIYRQRPLNFTTPVALKLYNLITAVVPKSWSDVVSKFPLEGVQEEDIPFGTLAEIQTAAQEFETVLRTECQMMDTYFVSKKGTYSTNDLVENAHYQVPEPTRNRLPDQTKFDLDQAGKCMALDVPTAAAFHLLRATEAVIRRYYEELVPGPKKAPSKMRNWGTYIRLLENHGADANVLSIITHLKDVYRNPVLHPEENYSDERVQVLFGVCVSAVVLIEMEREKIQAKGAMLPFAQKQALVAESNV